MENGKDYIAPTLTKRQPTSMQTPFCIACAKKVDHWLYHMNGHTDGSPILVLNCHSTSVTVGASLSGSDEFRKQMTEIYLPGYAIIYWNPDGTINGPTENPHPRQSAYRNDGAISGSDTGSLKDQTSRVTRDEPDLGTY